MASNVTFYEQARELGEVIWRGLRYRLFYEPQRRCTICVLVPGQKLGALDEQLTRRA